MGMMKRTGESHRRPHVYVQTGRREHTHVERMEEVVEARRGKHGCAYALIELGCA